MAPQTRPRIDPLGVDTYLRVRAETDCAALLGLGRPRTSRQFPINHLENDAPAGREHDEQEERDPDAVEPRQALVAVLWSPVLRRRLAHGLSIGGPARLLSSQRASSALHHRPVLRVVGIVLFRS